MPLLFVNGSVQAIDSDQSKSIDMGVIIHFPSQTRKILRCNRWGFGVESSTLSGSFGFLPVPSGACRWCWLVSLWTGLLRRFWAIRSRVRCSCRQSTSWQFFYGCWLFLRTFLFLLPGSRLTLRFFCWGIWWVQCLSQRTGWARLLPCSQIGSRKQL